MATLVVLGGYLATLAPNLTLQDAGELAVASAYAGVPHPPGYPVWTLYTWLFTILVPFSNIAWRVALSSAVAGACACGLLATLVSRMTHSALAGVAGADNDERRPMAWVAGLMAATLMGFNGFMWSQAVIVEVYTLSVLSLVGVLCLLFRWYHAPERQGPLLWAFFLFGICFTNHQTLLVAAMGIEVAILAMRPALGRDLLLGNTVVYILGLLLKVGGGLTSLAQNAPLFAIYNAVGLASLAGALVLWRRTRGLGSEWRTVVGLGSAWGAGAAFYLLLPVFSSANPPMNWGYPRTWDGFLHALTRGQYAQANPTQSLGQYFDQVMMYFGGALEEFGAVGLLLGLAPFLLWKTLARRDRAWLGGLLAVFACLALLLLVLLNPPPGRQSHELNKVFFTASHVVIAILIGLGAAAVSALLRADYAGRRRWGLYGSAVAAGVASYDVMHVASFHLIARAAAWTGVVLAGCAVLLFLGARTRFPSRGLLILLALLPVQSVLSHWSDNEQRGHWFGYWYGHDMFRPPFDLYPEMARDAILFGGTDPGRFTPTYMIFCESFMAPAQKPLDPTFDRRDVYLITQNALADSTYLDYLRGHYQVSARRDPPFFEEMLRSRRDQTLGTTNALARWVRPLDRALEVFGGSIEAQRRRRGVYPAKEIWIPSTLDLKEKVDAFVATMYERARQGEFGPSPDLNKIVNRPGGVMAVNGEVARMIFERNPGHEFYVEESYPIEWMYPHLTPHGIIFKLNRQPQVELPASVLERDRAFWKRYAARLCGDVVQDPVQVDALCEFVTRVYLQRDFRGFRGDPRFVRDSNAQKSFSGLRNSAAGLYHWRFLNSTNPEVKGRMRREAEFAYAQALSFCPYNAQAVGRFIELLMLDGRLKDALQVAQTSLAFDPEDPVFQALVIQLEQMAAGGGVGGAPAGVGRTNPELQEAVPRQR